MSRIQRLCAGWSNWTAFLPFSCEYFSSSVPEKNGASGVIYDDYSKVQLVVAGGEPVLVPDTYSYFSLMCIAGDVSGVTIKNAKYPLEKGTITSDYQYGVSNEVLPGQTAEVTLEKGVLLLVMVW